MVVEGLPGLGWRQHTAAPSWPSAAEQGVEVQACPGWAEVDRFVWMSKLALQCPFLVEVVREAFPPIFPTWRKTLTSRDNSLQQLWSNILVVVVLWGKPVAAASSALRSSHSHVLLLCCSYYYWLIIIIIINGGILLLTDSHHHHHHGGNKPLAQFYPSQTKTCLWGLCLKSQGQWSASSSLPGPESTLEAPIS